MEFSLAQRDLTFTITASTSDITSYSNKNGHISVATTFGSNRLEYATEYDVGVNERSVIFNHYILSPIYTSEMFTT